MQRRPKPSFLFLLQLTQWTRRFHHRAVTLRRRPIHRSTPRRECANLPCAAASAGREEQQQRRRRSTAMSSRRRRRKGERVPRTRGTARGICRTGSCRGEAALRLLLRRGVGRSRPPGRRPRKGEEEALEKWTSKPLSSSLSPRSLSPLSLVPVFDESQGSMGASSRALAQSARWKTKERRKRAVEKGGAL